MNHHSPIRPAATQAWPCVAFDVAMLMEKAYRAMQAADSASDAVMDGRPQDSARDALSDLSKSLAYIPSHTPEGALATACALYGRIDINTEDLTIFERHDMQRARLVVLQLIGFIERRFGIDRRDLGLDYFVADWTEATHLPWMVGEEIAA